jgi:4-coumarate--CoA ligase
LLQFRDRMLRVLILCVVWGMTESSCIISMVPYPEADIGSVGYLLPNHDIKFIDDDDREITTPDTRGEMCVRGPGIIRGYFENPEANAREFDSEGYYHSGDVGYFEKGTGKIFIVDRKKELIKVRGFQVAPNEIEGVLLLHPAIVDVAVIGLTVASSPDAELVRACVVLRDGHEVSEKEVAEFVGKQLAKYKSLTGGVKFYSAIPKTASGKILKRLLREEAMRELKAEGAKL